MSKTEALSAPPATAQRIEPKDLCSNQAALVQRALGLLGIEDLVLIVHDASFPAGDAWDLGRGSPYGEAGRSFLRFVAELGFTGVQLGPQGMTSHDNASPYDGTVFSRGILSIDFSATALDDAAADLPPTACYAEAYARAHGLLARLHEKLVAARRAGEAWAAALDRDLSAFREAHASWLVPDALYAALFEVNGRRDFSAWPAEQRDLWLQPEPHRAALVERLTTRHGEAIERYALGQLVAHEQHASLRAELARSGLELFGDLQVGYSRQDSWRHRAAFLPDYAMGAPPSRSNPEGQPWGFPVLDPSRYGTLAAPGPALALLLARIDKSLREYDRVRVDHPHGLVCPWVYRADAPDPLAAVQNGARLFSSPDVPEHPELARFAIPSAAQLDRSLPRFHDGVVRELDAAQVDRYAILFDAVCERARVLGRGAQAFLCEVLSTQPNELAAVMRRFGMGRFRITQKANVRDPADVYRGENAQPADWVMLGNHDTPSIWAVAERWQDAGAREADYLATRLGADARLFDPRRADPRALVEAKAAELFLGPARHVMIFWCDLFGEHRPYNQPGTVGEHNWSLRLLADYRGDYARKLATKEAISLPRVLALALRAKRGGSHEAQAVIRRLEALTDHTPGP